MEARIVYISSGQFSLCPASILCLSPAYFSERFHEVPEDRQESYLRAKLKSLTSALEWKELPKREGEVVNLVMQSHMLSVMRLPHERYLFEHTCYIGRTGNWRVILREIWDARYEPIPSFAYTPEVILKTWEDLYNQCFGTFGQSHRSMDRNNGYKVYP